MNIRKSVATVGVAGAMVSGSLFLASPAQAQPLVTGGLVNVTVTDVLNNNRILQNVGIGVAANVMAQVCGTQVGANVLTILSATRQGQAVSCTNSQRRQTVTVSQTGG